MVEHEPCTLLVGVEEGLGTAGPASGMSGTLYTLTPFGIRRVFISRGDPLVGRPVADPGGGTAMKV